MLRRLHFAARIISRSKRYDYSSKWPYCGHTETQLRQRKYWVLQLRECKSCRLMFRLPKDSISYSDKFHNHTYKQENDLTTYFPGRAELEPLLTTNLIGSEKDFSARIATLQRLTHGKGKLLEFGPSWGYFLYQAAKSGFDCCGVEMSRNRAQYGIANLKVQIYTDPQSIPDNSFDVIYSCHVLEHVADLASTFRFFIRALSNNGLLVIECPNCSSEDAKRQGAYYGPMIGEAYVNGLTPLFFLNALSSYGFNVRMATREKDVVEIDCFFDRPQEH